MARASTVLIVAVGLLLGTLPPPVPGGMQALAQNYRPPPGPYAPSPGPYAPYDAPPARGRASGPVDADAAVRMLRGRGFSNISVIRRRGATILLEANGPRGERVQVVVDGASGAISGMKVIGFGDKRY
ncbi:hypothetical protein EV667_4409 [Ancylobacter aquaticus]|uniref:PepSY domain-containing protein n=1 Tax=Ancylobacter aquaticus TaxID=100 RepID=A0A4R1H947_ANCAQ|nr:hypothetical protein [Ancylobacter aquaticus]TCK16635.1 hypothetical protein EV667_4409 [Ancylobacter aquaticus]